ncbi:MAG: glutamate racemase [Candidatus Hydrogenedentes bacterium CG07_land_8_20_14_0_80_42_17]|nr:MAG: glutamate racemase [Candidatus Hydrogenedentes bacterium CG07_land_8_20_14_0_80_42_17]
MGRVAQKGRKELKDAPIGIFDSGIGGLTVVRRIGEVLPNESIVYIGDTARIPYGSKSPQTVKNFSIEIGSYLAEIGVKAVVIACNTASSYGLSTLSAILPVPVLGVVGPGARVAATASKNGKIGVIGTRGTICSEAYQSAILANRPELRVYAAEAPLLVPFVEEGHLDDEFVKLALKLYLDPILEKGIDTLVLGCTHYPLLQPAIEKYVGDKVNVIDSASATALALKELLKKTELMKDSGTVLKKRFYCTDNPQGFRREGSRFLGKEIEIVELLPLEELQRAGSKR